MQIKKLSAQELTAQNYVTYVALGSDNSINWVYLSLHKGYGKSPIWIAFANGSKAFENIYVTKTEVSEKLKMLNKYGSSVFALTLDWGESIHFNIFDERNLIAELQAKSLSGKRTTVARKPVRKTAPKRK